MILDILEELRENVKYLEKHGNYSERKEIKLNVAEMEQIIKAIENTTFLNKILENMGVKL